MSRRGSIATESAARLLAELVAKQVLTPEQVTEAVVLHDREEVWIGHVLLAHGFCSRLELYRTWAECLGVDFVNLVTDPPDAAAIDDRAVNTMLVAQWVPWRLGAVDGARVLTVATAAPDVLPDAELRVRYGVDEVRYVITTDWDILEALSLVANSEMARLARDTLEVERPELSARTGASIWQKAVLVSWVVFMAALASWQPFVGLATLLFLLNIFFAGSILSKAVLSVAGGRALRRQSEQRWRDIAAHGPQRAPVRIPDADLPLYTILVPCYREQNVIARVIGHIERLDYPRSKLQVLLLLEVDDVETIEAAKRTRPPDWLRIVVLPDGTPRTKPRACNVGLAMARGDLLVIYDAEDEPEPSQLRDVVARFHELGPETVCLQARLNYFNARQNLLTRMFTLEYSMWFDYMLLGLDELRLPIPLGGTSNHFRTAALRELGGWDPYNVTEDADLGIRATALGLRVGTVESTTWEEACSAIVPWIRQRTRWIKGYMMTGLVHTRSLRRLYRTTGLRGVSTLLFFIAGTPLTFLVNPIVIVLGAYGVFGLPLPNFRMQNFLTVLSTTDLAFGTMTMVLFTALAVRRRRQWWLLGYAAFNPIYWLLHSAAAWRALYQLIREPARWEKTPHGLVDDAETS